jgi:hypothetical protein
MVLEKQSHLYLSVSQKDKRCFNRNEQYEYSNTRLILAKVNADGSLEYIFGKMKMDREVWEEEELDAGDYLCYVESDWTGDTSDFVLSAYSRFEAYFT